MFGIGSPRGLVAQILQDLAGKAPHLQIVFHDQHMALRGVMDRRRFVLWAVLCRVLGRDLRQVQGKHRALAQGAGYIDIASRLLGEAEYLGQPQPRAFAHGFGGKKRFENALDGVAGNAGAGVGQGNGDMRLARTGLAAYARQGLLTGQAQGEGAVTVHGVPRIEGDVDQCGFELA